MDKSKETVPVEAEFVRFLNELEDKPKGLTVAELQMTGQVRIAPTPPPKGGFELPQGPAFMNGKWYL